MSHSPSDSGSDWPGIDQVDDREYHRLLSSRRRRILLDVLEDSPPSVDLDTVAREVADREANHQTASAVTLEAVAVTLHHDHLPRLAELELVEYDAPSHGIEVFHDRLPV